MKHLFYLSAVSLLFISSCQSQIKNAQSETVKVHGNCGMCKSTIETAGTVKKVSEVQWDEKTQMASITFDAQKTSLNAVLKNIALAGYDNDQFLAPTTAYNALHECCKYDRKKEAQATVATGSATFKDHSGHTQANIDNNSGNETKSKNTTMETILTAYLQLKDALVASDFALSSKEAGELSSAYNLIDITALDDETRNALKPNQTTINQHIDAISKSKTLEDQRQHFAMLSEVLYKTVKSTKHKVVLYYQNCPMYNDGKGANWLSRENAIKNPYYGSQMLTCGKTLETIQ